MLEGGGGIPIGGGGTAYDVGLLAMGFINIASIEGLKSLFVYTSTL